MDTLDRYLAKEFLIYLAITLLGLVAIFLTIDFFSRFWSLKLPFAKVMLLYLYKVPEAVNLFFPVGVLMSTLLVVINMSRQNEILALYTGGMGVLRVTSTFITLVSILSTIAFISFDSLVPALEKKRFLIKQGVEPTEANFISFFPSRSWYRRGNLIYNVGNFDPKTSQLENISVYYLDPFFNITQRIQAKKGNYINNDWVIEDGQNIRYPEGTFPIAEPFEQMTGLISDPPAQFKAIFTSKQYLRLKELRYRIEQTRALRLDTTDPAVGYHERLAIVFSPLIFTLIAIPLASKPFRNYSMTKGVGFSFFIVLLYLVIFRFSLSMGKGGHIPPIIAGWAANVLFLSFGLVRLYKSHKFH